MTSLPSTAELCTGRFAFARRAFSGTRPWAVCLGAGALVVCAGCSARQNPPAPVVDCAASDAPYDFWILETYDPTEAGTTNYGWYGYGDLTPGGFWLQSPTVTNSPPTVPIENGGPCGSSSYPSAPTEDALLLEAHGFQDYGNGWGSYNLGGNYTVPPYTGIGPQNVDASCTWPDGDASVCPINAVAYDGITFWARSYDPSGAPTSKGFTLELNDDASAGGLVDSTCVPYEAGVLGEYTTAPTGAATGPAGGSTTSTLPPADACGNPFSYEFLTTDQWVLYTLPWSSFNQLAQPNRISTGFDPATFQQVLFVAPKEARSYLWIDTLGFYRAKQP